jgi:hypothetical protein
MVGEVGVAAVGLVIVVAVAAVLVVAVEAEEVVDEAALEVALAVMIEAVEAVDEVVGEVVDEVDLMVHHVVEVAVAPQELATLGLVVLPPLRAQRSLFNGLDILHPSSCLLPRVIASIYMCTILFLNSHISFLSIYSIEPRIQTSAYSPCTR